MLKKAVKIMAIVMSACIVLAGFSVICAYYYIGKTSAADYTSTTASVQYTKASRSRDGYASIVIPADRDIKLLTLADPQVSTSPRYTIVGGSNEKTYEFVEDLVVTTKPDIVTIVGDLAFTYSNNQWQYVERYAEIFERTNTLWAFCFGNHDSQNEYVEPFSNASKPNGQMAKSKILRALSKYPHCLVDPFNSNYIINVKDTDGNYVRSLVYFDCEYDGGEGYYRNLTEKQLQWYTSAIAKITRLAYGKRSDNVIPSSVFTHVCPAEYLQAALSLSKGNTEDVVYHYGDILQGINVKNNNYYYDETVNENDAFNTFVKVGSTDSVYFGHLHDNDMSLTYKNVRLTSVQHSGFSHSYRLSIKDDNTVDLRDVFKYGDNRGGTFISLSKDGGLQQYQVIGREVLSNYYEDYAIDYDYYISQLQADPAYNVLY